MEIKTVQPHKAFFLKEGGCYWMAREGVGREATYKFRVNSNPVFIRYYVSRIQNTHNG